MCSSSNRNIIGYHCSCACGVRIFSGAEQKFLLMFSINPLVNISFFSLAFIINSPPVCFIHYQTSHIPVETRIIPSRFSFDIHRFSSQAVPNSTSQYSASAASRRTSGASRAPKSAPASGQYGACSRGGSR